MREILILELENTGHHVSSYLRALLLNKPAGLKYKVLVTKNVYESVELNSILLSNVIGDVEIVSANMSIFRFNGSSKIGYLITQILNYFLICYMYYITLSRSSRKSIEHVVLINLDHIDKVIGLFGSPFGEKDFSGILMNIKFHREWGNKDIKKLYRIYYWLFGSLIDIQTLKVVFVVDELFFDLLEKQIFRRNLNKVKFLYDLGQIQSGFGNKRATFSELNEFSNILLVYGYISEKKGVYMLIDLLSVLPRDWGMMICGRHDESMKTYFCNEEASISNIEKLYRRDSFIDVQTEKLLFCRSKLVWLCYQGDSYGSSGVLYQACSAGKPVVAYEGTLIGFVVSKYNLGYVVPKTFSSREFATLFGLIEKSGPDYMGKVKSCLAHAKLHSEEYFATTIFRSI